MKLVLLSIRGSLSCARYFHEDVSELDPVEPELERRVLISFSFHKFGFNAS